MHSPDWLQIRKALARDGYARLGPVLSPEQAAALGDQLSAAASQVAESESPYGVLIHNVSETAAACRTLLDSGRLDALARGTLDLDEVILFQDLLIWKHAGNATDLAWHQDYSYWPLRPAVAGMMWIALDDATAENGCLHYVPGSHEWGELRPTPFSEDMPISPALAHLAPIDLELAERSAVAVPVPAGEAIIHHPLVWHMSPTNTTRAPRRALATTWTSTDAVWDPGHANHPYNFTLRPTPGSLVLGERFPARRAWPAE